MLSDTLETKRNPYMRAQSLAELLAWNDVNFVRCAYVTLLGRQPDLEGEANYKAMIRAGKSKMAVLHALRSSQEGRAHDPGIAGLDRHLRRYRRSMLPFIGTLFRWFFKSNSEDSATQLRKIDNSVEISLEGVRDLQATVSETSENLITVISALPLLQQTSKCAEQKVDQVLAHAGSVEAVLMSFVTEFRAFRDEQIARFQDMTATNHVQDNLTSLVNEFRAFRDQEAAQSRTDSEVTRSIMTSFVGEFRAFRDEETKRSSADTENSRAILTSFVEEFRAFREEETLRSRMELDAIRGLKKLFESEFDVLGSRQEIRLNEFRDLLNMGFDGHYQDGGQSTFSSGGLDKSLPRHAPTVARIIKQLKSSRT